MDSQVWLDAVKAAQDNAIEGLNKAGEIFYDCEENRNILRQLLVTENVSKDLWVAPTLWISAAIGARADGVLRQRPTREETARAREAADRAAGQTKYRKDGETTTPKESSVHDAMSLVESMLRGEKPGAADAPNAEVAVIWPPFDKDVENMEPAERKLFRALSAADTRKWMAKRAEFVRAEAAANARSMAGSVRLKGEPR